MRSRRLSKSGLTLIETLLAVALVTMVGLALYHSFSMGVNVWDRSQQVNIEEDVAIFFDKLSFDLYNSFLFSQIKFEGNEFRFAFPTIVYTRADRGLRLEPDAYIDQVGKVEYYYDFNDDVLYRREANYSQAIKERWGEPRALIKSVSRIKFRYYFMTDTEEISSSEILDVLPTGVEIEVEFTDSRGTRVMKKFVDIPVGS